MKLITDITKVICIIEALKRNNNSNSMIGPIYIKYRLAKVARKLLNLEINPKYLSGKILNNSATTMTIKAVEFIHITIGSEILLLTSFSFIISTVLFTL